MNTVRPKKHNQESESNPMRSVENSEDEQSEPLFDSGSDDEDNVVLLLCCIHITIIIIWVAVSISIVSMVCNNYFQLL